MLDIEVSQIIVQILAFLILFWVMKRYGWKPLMEILEERRKTIQEEFEGIEKQKKELSGLTSQYQEKLQEIEKEMRSKIQQAVAEGKQVSLEMQQEAQVRGKEIVQKAKLEIEEEMIKAKQQLKEEVVQLVMLATKKMIQEELDEPRQKRMITQFLDEAKF